MSGISAFSASRLCWEMAETGGDIRQGWRARTGRWGAVSQGELGAVNSGQTVSTTSLGMLDDSGHTIVIGEGEGLQTKLDGG